MEALRSHVTKTIHVKDVVLSMFHTFPVSSGASPSSLGPKPRPNRPLDLDLAAIQVVVTCHLFDFGGLKVTCYQDYTCKRCCPEYVSWCCSVISWCFSVVSCCFSAVLVLFRGVLVLFRGVLVLFRDILVLFRGVLVLFRVVLVLV